MFFENNYISYTKSSNINISSYKFIMTKFINKYIENNVNLNTKIILADAIIYSKYYLYYKILNCSYNKYIMDIIFNYEYDVIKS